MSRNKKIALGIVIALAAIVVAAILIIPALIDVDRYRPEVAARIQAETGGPVEIGHLSLTFFPSIAIRVDDFVMSNPKGFPEGDFVKAKRIYVVVDAGALWNRQVSIRSLELDDPEITLLETAKGHWNFESQSPSGQVKKASFIDAPSFSLGIIAKVTIAKGSLSAATLSAAGRAEPAFFEAHGISSQLEQVDLNALGGTGSKALAPRPGTDMARGLLWTPAIVYAASAGPGSQESPQAELAAQGTLNADQLRFQTYRVSAVKSKVRLFAKEIFVDDLDMDLYGGKAKGNIRFNFAELTPSYKIKAKVSGVDMSKLLAEIPGAQGWMTGKMQGDIDLVGAVVHSPDPLAGMRGTGNISVRNGNMPKLQLNKSLLELAKVGNFGPSKGDPGAFSSIVADLNIAAGKITSHKINVVGNGVGAEGAGSMTLLGAGTLDYQGIASLVAQSNGLTTMLAGLSGATMENGKMNFPFTIGGTLAAPKYSLKGGNQLGNLGKLAGGNNPAAGQTQNPADLVQGIMGAFKKKKK